MRLAILFLLKTTEAPTLEEFKTFLTSNGYTELNAELTQFPARFESWKKRTKEDWKEELNAIQGNVSGFSDIFNYLHPKKTHDTPGTSLTSISCKSQSISGPRRHVDGNRGMQKRFKKQLVKRDACCIATGVKEGLVAAHIVTLDKSELITRENLFSPCNGVLLHEDLEDDYDRHKWMFDYAGNVTVLYPKWLHKDIIRHVLISTDPTIGPSRELIETHNRIALESAQHHCPHCWKYVGVLNIEDHTSGSCEALDAIGDENDYNEIEDV